MDDIKKLVESEDLREALLDLERVNNREREIRLEAEALLAGLNVLTNFKNREKTFIQLLEVLRELIRFDEAFVMIDGKDGNLFTTASTHPKFEKMAWSITDLAPWRATGRPLAFFDIDFVPEWKKQSPSILENVCSTLQIFLQDQSRSAVLVCTHPTRGFFSDKHLRMAARFAPLASQALTNIGYTADLENMNNNLQMEIKERQAAEEVATRSQEQLVNNSKMAALGEMAGGMAHEINTPLATITLLVDLLDDLIAEETFDKVEVGNAVGSIRETTNRIAKIVSGLRTFARDGTVDKMQPVLLKNLVDDTLSFCRERFKNNGVRLEVAEIDKSFTTLGRAVELSQVVLNLLNNSYDAIESETDKWIKISVTEEKTVFKIRISDCGKGIPQDVQTKMFQPFFTTKPIGKGTGMGLSISSGIIKKHSGEISIDNSSPNTCFVIQLPRYPNPQI
jgi:signal transduction histidine kinase